MHALKAFLLVAGRGKRLRPLTDKTPKCLLPINGKPLLQIWLEHLLATGVDEVLINTHWLHDQVEDFVGQWSARVNRMKVILSYEPQLLGSAGTILVHRRWAGPGPFFIIYGDNLTQLNLQKMLAFHNEHALPLTIRVYQGADPRRAGIVRLDENGIVLEFEEKPRQPQSNIGAGAIYVAEASIFDYFPAAPDRRGDGVLDLSHHVLPRLAGKMIAYDSGEFAMDIGTHASYEAARKIWRVGGHGAR